MSGAERRAVQEASRAAHAVRRGRRYRAVLLLADAQRPRAVAVLLGAARSSSYTWAAAWRRAGLSGLDEGPLRGMVRRVDAAGERGLDTLLASAPQTHGYPVPGWSVPLLRRAAAQAGYAVRAAPRRRVLRRLGWKRPTSVLGRPDPAYAEKKTP